MLEEEEHLKRTLAEEQTAPAAVAKHTKAKHLPSLQSAEEAATKQLNQDQDSWSCTSDGSLRR